MKNPEGSKSLSRIAFVSALAASIAVASGCGDTNKTATSQHARKVAEPVCKGVKLESLGHGNFNIIPKLNHAFEYPAHVISYLVSPDIGGAASESASSSNSGTVGNNSPSAEGSSSNESGGKIAESTASFESSAAGSSTQSETPAESEFQKSIQGYMQEQVSVDYVSYLQPDSPPGQLELWDFHKVDPNSDASAGYNYATVTCPQVNLGHMITATISNGS